MFEELRDSLSFLWSWTWPVTPGEVTEVMIERLQDKDDLPRLAVAYKFSVGDDGPYTGESFWKPTFSIGATRKFAEATRKLRHKKDVLVRYKRADPSMNRLDSSVWRNL